MSVQEAAEVLSAYVNGSLLSWLVTVGCVVVILFYAARQSDRNRGL